MLQKLQTQKKKKSWIKPQFKLNQNPCVFQNYNSCFPKAISRKGKTFRMITVFSQSLFPKIESWINVSWLVPIFLTPNSPTKTRQ